MQNTERRRLALEAAAGEGADALVVTHGADVRWLSGFTGSSGAVALGRSGGALFTDGRYTTQAKAEAAGLRVVIGKGAPGGAAVAWLAERAAKRCAFDAVTTTVAGLEAMRKMLPAAKRRGFFVATKGVVAKLRERKDADEIVKMRRAARLGCRLFEGVVKRMVPGVTEMEVALAMEVEARRAGAEAMSFETIVASGARSALPHGRASGAKLSRRGFVTLDFGVLLDGYCSDMTRTVHLGKATAREWDVYHSVLEAQQAGVAAVRPGARCGDVDEAARSVLKRARLERWFTHSTGHGVGLEIHEGPRIAGQVPGREEQLLEPGMVVTIEPGVYLPGKFGVRIEDMVLVTERGGEVLTAASPKVWMEL
ncbi:MAG TPA: aminopeptidase P family protein [Acidobacteriaceae bacterium]|jgi:Xaa-Pro aminopeptidase|nr:aminopeptidase P family protein [Acidobacteriaceae bacterium]